MGVKQVKEGLLDRRQFIAAAAAAGSGLAAPALAQAPATQEWQWPEEWNPRVVRINASVAPGEIHVVPRDFSLYWTTEPGRAIRYKVGIGRPGLYESGTFFIGAKKEWPAWTPTPEMIEREPHIYEKWKDGMPGGPNNPLGARALYLFTPNRGDTFLRIHGTADPRGIGRQVSNGCARLVNSHAIHLYDQVPMGTKVVLYPKV
jgi:lipoprotein-anchoring transpeptidase ErfK/SrfK